MKSTHTKIIDIVDNETGEIKYHKKQPLFSPFKRGLGYSFKYNSIKVSGYADISLPKELDDLTIGRMYRLSKHLYSVTNMLARRSNNKIKPYQITDIAKVLSMSDRQASDFFRVCNQYGVMKRTKVEPKLYQYYFNPLYFNSTKYISLDLYILFQDELTAYFEPWVIKEYLDEIEYGHNNIKRKGDK